MSSLLPPLLLSPLWMAPNIHFDFSIFKVHWNMGWHRLILNPLRHPSSRRKWLEDEDFKTGIQCVPSLPFSGEVSDWEVLLDWCGQPKVGDLIRACTLPFPDLWSSRLRAFQGRWIAQNVKLTSPHSVVVEAPLFLCWRVPRKAGQLTFFIGIEERVNPVPMI